MSPLKTFDIFPYLGGFLKSGFPKSSIFHRISHLINPPTLGAPQVGIVGTTGCGKSSFLLVLLRVLEPRGGRVLLNGVDTRDIGLATLREAMGLVPQE